MPPKKRSAAVVVADKEKDGSSSESEDEKLTKEAKKNKAKWFWRGDSGKGELDVWVKYSDDVALKLEKGFLATKKKDAKNPTMEIKVDKDRYVDLKKLVQRRYDDKKKKRPVKRSTPDSEESTDEDEMKKIQKRETRSSAKAAAKKKVVKADTSSEEEEGEEEEDIVKWMWAGDSNGGPEKGGGHQDVWIDYDKKICKKLEKAFTNATDKEVKVDNQRFIDLQNMLQRRYDDPSKRRNVKRIPPKAKKAPAKAASKPKAKGTTTSTSKKRKNDDTESDSEEEEEEKKEKKKASKKTSDDEDEQKTKKAKTTPTLTSAPSAMDLLKLPLTWTNQTAMDYQEVDLDPKSTEFMNIKAHFMDSVEPSHKHNSAIHKILFSNFEVTKVVRIQCPILWLRYKARKDKILNDAGGVPIPPVPNVFKLTSTDAPVNEFFLYHGLNVSAMPGIAKFGFDPRYCNLAGMFGAGLYFAENSSKSHQYCHAGECTASGPNPASCRCKQSDECCMLICRVTLGDALIEKIYRGNAPGQFWYNKRTEPEKVPGKSIYHSVVGESKKWFPSASLNFREYIVYESSQVYPEYILSFKRIK